MDVWTCAVGFEEALAAELGAGAATLAPGVVASQGGGEPRDAVFAGQVLPAAEELAGESIARLAQAAFDRVAGPLDGCGPWTLHAAGVDEGDGPLAARATRVGEALLGLAREKRKRTSRRFVAPGALSAAQLADPALRLVQLLLLEPGRALLSLAAPRPLAVGGAWPDPRWPAGRVPVADDFHAPSSAYRKAEEAYALLDAAPAAGERAVDLGGAPGGWSWTALRRGARVLAVDRAPLEPPVAGHALLEARIGDAFALEPPDPPVDWLLCDVIAAPARTLELLERWLARGWCRRFVVTVKFKGTDRAADLAALAELLLRHGGRARVKHLRHGKNEVTAFGEGLRGDAPAD